MMSSSNIFSKTWSIKLLLESLQKGNVENQYGDMKQSPDSLRIVLLGKKGCGKSSTGNTILGRKEFEAELGQKSGSRCCQKAHGEVKGRPVTVVDTPGLFDTSLSVEEVYEEMIKCISLLAPGPHVFLLVVNIGRFTEEEKMTLKGIKEGFGVNAEKFTIVLFTGGDLLKQDNMTIDEYIKTKCTDSFKKLIADCGGRYHLFDNRNDKNQKQVSELITKIDVMVKENGGSCYTNEMLQEAEAAVKKEMEKLLKQKEEEMRKEIEELKIKHKEEMKAMEREIEGDKLRLQEDEQLRKAMEEDHERKVEDLKKTYEEKARKKDEEFSDLKEKYEALQKTKALSELKEGQLKKKYRIVSNSMVKSVTRGNLSKMINLLDKQEEEIMQENTVEGIKVLQEKHDEEISDLWEELLAEEDKWCFCVRRAVTHWMHFPCIIAACIHAFILASMLSIFNFFFINH